MDTETAYLNAEMEKTVYIELPPTFTSGAPNKTCRLNMALYGTIQAGRWWNIKLDEMLQADGAHKTVADPCMYKWDQDEHGLICAIVHVDDIAIFAPTIGGVDMVKGIVKKSFEIRDLGEVTDFLGMRVKRDRASKMLALSNPGHTDALLNSFGMNEASSKMTPLQPGTYPIHTSGIPLPPDNRYAEVIGSLLYLSSTTRPDISFAVGYLSRYMSNPEV